MSKWWEYNELQSGFPYDWTPANRGNNPDDNLDFHVDLGAGKVPKARLSIDRHGDVDIQMDLNTMEIFGSKHGPIGQIDHELPFPSDSIESIISHHCLEHIGDGFIHLMDECYRILKPGGKFRIIVPLFPSLAAVTDPDHCRYFTNESFNSFVHSAGPNDPFWSDSFAEPYTKCRFRRIQQDWTAPEKLGDVMGGISIDDLFAEPREIRATLTK